MDKVNPLGTLHDHLFRGRQDPAYCNFNTTDVVNFIQLKLMTEIILGSANPTIQQPKLST